MTRMREVAAGDIGALVAMNNAAVPAVNPHDRSSFEELVAMADRAWVVDDAPVLAAVLVAFAPGAPYQSPNYTWLSARYERFAYVDRIIVAPSHRRLGLAGRLYDTLAEHARSRGFARLLCEVNVEPPNPRSIAFHEAVGWRAIADRVHGPGRVVRYFERLVST